MITILSAGEVMRMALLKLLMVNGLILRNLDSTVLGILLWDVFQ